MTCTFHVCVTELLLPLTCRMNSAFTHLPLQGQWMKRVVDQFASLEDAEKLKRAGFEITLDAQALAQLKDDDGTLLHETQKAQKFFQLQLEVAPWLPDYTAYSRLASKS